MGAENSKAYSKDNHKTEGRQTYPNLWMVHNEQGLIQLRRFCVNVRAASQISFKLTEDFQFLLQIDTCICHKLLSKTSG